MIYEGILDADPEPGPADPGGRDALHATGALVPSGRAFSGRVLNLGQGSGKGVFCPLKAGDGVLVLMVEGDHQRAIVLGGLANGRTGRPMSEDQLILMHQDGTLLSHQDGADSYRIVHEELVRSLASYTAALETFMVGLAALAADPFNAALVPLAVAFQASVGGPVSDLSGDLAASLVAGPPFLSPHHKVT